ncbi:hypothetical protein CEE37_06735 [candidate division LCP-89 bacterium B3_LCP]|uniref:Helix-turn-helix domain-containing protein n=1 Tax=candidate division LCP-89 bacterium B3_LCP TaxID=2012998 RepID=A0A532V0B7_UNCL8|nr:MAG: hypothetical protein CEE37_06735 [candidate division LCP-89 bacterium B3_LCP]
MENQSGQSGIRYPLAELLSTEEMETLLGVSRQTLYGLRKKGMPYVRLGQRVFYIEPNVMAWLKTVETSET